MNPILDTYVCIHSETGTPLLYFLLAAAALLIVVVATAVGIIWRRRRINAAKNSHSPTEMKLNELLHAEETCSGSGAGLPTFVQRTISKDIKLKHLVGEGRCVYL